jgi:hypothetical protein
MNEKERKELYAVEEREVIMLAVVLFIVAICAIVSFVILLFG